MSGKVIIRGSTHFINGNEITFEQVTQTVGDPSSRWVTVTDPEGVTVRVEFDPEGFELLKDIIENY